jgi:ribosomal protein S1
VKLTLSHLKVGDFIEGRILEIQDDGSMVVSFQGDLIRVSNQTQKTLKCGSFIDLIVTAVSPYAFRLAENQGQHIDVSI